MQRIISSSLGFPIATAELAAATSPYMRKNIRRFGKYGLDMEEMPAPLFLSRCLSKYPCDNFLHVSSGYPEFLSTKFVGGPRPIPNAKPVALTAAAGLRPHKPASDERPAADAMEGTDVAGWAGRPKAMIESISALTLATHDMPRAVRFYVALGFDLIYGGADARFTSFRAGSGYLNLTAQPDDRQWAWWGRAILYVADVDANALAGHRRRLPTRHRATGRPLGRTLLPRH